MADPLITLTTDFGLASPYVAAVKGVILGFNPAVRLIDLSHALPPQDVYHAAFFLASSVVYFPDDTLHVVVVDPGVGTERANRKSTRLNSSHVRISYAVFCLKQKSIN